MNKDDDLHNIKNTISQDRTAGNTVVEELNALKEPEGASRAKKRNSDRRIVLLPGDSSVVGAENLDNENFMLQEPPPVDISSPDHLKRVKQVQLQLGKNRKHLRTIDASQEISYLSRGAEYQSQRGIFEDWGTTTAKEPGVPGEVSAPEKHKAESNTHGHFDSGSLEDHTDNGKPMEEPPTIDPKEVENHATMSTSSMANLASTPEEENPWAIEQIIGSHPRTQMFQGEPTCEGTQKREGENTYALSSDSDAVSDPNSNLPLSRQQKSNQKKKMYTIEGINKTSSQAHTEQVLPKYSTQQRRLTESGPPTVDHSSLCGDDRQLSNSDSDSIKCFASGFTSPGSLPVRKATIAYDVEGRPHEIKSSSIQSDDGSQSTHFSNIPAHKPRKSKVRSYGEIHTPKYSFEPVTRPVLPQSPTETTPVYTRRSQYPFRPAIVSDDELLPMSDSKMEYSILAEVRCSSRTPYDYHSQYLFEDAPYIKGTLRTVSCHLHGRRAIGNLEAYVARRGLSFVVIRNYSCSANNETLVVVKSFEDDETSAYYPMLGKSHQKRVPPPEPRENEVYLDEKVRREVEERIVIYSEDLIGKIHKISKFTPGVLVGEENGQPCGPLVLIFPYLTIFHHRDELKELAKTGKEEDCEIQCLLLYCDSCQGDKYTRADEIFSKGEMTREFQPFLFHPLEPIVYHEKDLCSAYISTTFDQSDWFAITFECWSWGSNGVHLGRKLRKMKMHWPKKDRIAITQLEIYPLRYAKQETRDLLLRQGTKYWDLRYQRKIAYSGWDVPRDQKHYESRFIVDQETYRKLHPMAPIFAFSTDPISQFDKYPVEIELDKELSDLDFILCPHIIQGFYLKEKHWVSLYVNQVEDVKWNKEAFERLVLPPRQKEIIKALVLRTSARESDQTGVCGGKRQDLIVGKGTGLVVLLHGGPGTGKTLTAESVAELAEMPLYSVTCGDIGSEPEEVEAYLKRVLFFGKTWNCVLLLDEADVFLEERSLQDLKRNSLVSVFLRLLEYYSGVLILTTNRVGSFDEAFKSRIQLPLRFPDPDPPFRKKIWHNFFDMLETDEEDADLDELKEHLDELSDLDMNGREIRNSLTTARQLAQYKKKTLAWVHLNQAVKTTKEFNSYLTDVRGHSSKDWFREVNLR